MVASIAELLAAPLGAANIQLRIALVSKTHAAVKLHRAVTGKRQRIGRLGAKLFQFLWCY